MFNLHCPDGPPKLRENYGFSQVECGRIKSALDKKLKNLCAAWSEIHGNP